MVVPCEKSSHQSVSGNSSIRPWAKTSSSVVVTLWLVLACFISIPCLTSWLWMLSDACVNILLWLSSQATPKGLLPQHNQVLFHLKDYEALVVFGVSSCRILLITLSLFLWVLLPFPRTRPPWRLQVDIDSIIWCRCVIFGSRSCLCSNCWHLMLITSHFSLICHFCRKINGLIIMLSFYSGILLKLTEVYAWSILFLFRDGV